MTRRALALTATFSVLTTVVSRPASAQEVRPAARENTGRTTSQKPAGSGLLSGWEFEVHGGGSMSGASSGGLTLPAPGPIFPTFSGLPSRQVRSWFFGDGAVALNQNLASGNLTPRITPLDSILNASSARPGGPIGVRASRPLTSRIGLEFSFDVLGSLSLTSEAKDAARATRDTFRSAFDARLASFSNRAVIANLGLTDGGKPLLITGAVTFGLPGWGKLRPYAVFGGGVWASTGDGPMISLDGDYFFLSGSLTPYHQTDELDVEYRSGSSLALLFGAGFRYAFNNRSGLRLDFRGHVASDPTEVVVNWRPTTIPGAPANTIFLSGTPAIQISNGSLQNTLSLTQSQPDLVVASADGMRRMMNFTVGYYYRFGGVAAPAARTPAAAQTGVKPGSQMWQSNRVWEFDVHGGGAFGNEPEGGTSGTFPTGEPFTTATGRTSRYASTWMFGDGAVLINEIANGFTGVVPDRMSSLNPVLTQRSLERSGGGGIGARVSRRITQRIRLEFSVDAASTSLKFSDEALTQIERTRAAFAPVWNGLIATGAGIFQNPQVSAEANITESARSWQTAVTGGIEMRLWAGARTTAHANVSAGVVTASSTLPEATITGSYQFLFLGTAPLSERDVVRVHYKSASSPLFILGGGVKRFLSPGRGIRADVQLQITGNRLDTLVNASPTMTPGTPTFSINSATTPTLRFSNTTAVRGNLTGPAVVDFESFKASGRRIQVSVTAGYFFRF